MSTTEAPGGITRREATLLVAAGALASALPEPSQCAIFKEQPMALTCFIRYQIDPFQREPFAQYAAAWGRIIPKCGGNLIGYFLPLEGTNDIGWGLISFPSLAAYEIYRAKLRTDPQSRANFAFAQEHRFILREERTFLENVDGTIGIPAE